MKPRSVIEGVVLAGLLGACASPAASVATNQGGPAPVAPLGTRRVGVVDDCVQQPGQPAAEPLRIAFTGVAKSARCQREVYTIMGGLTHFLGVECKHCHLEPDYTADTHNKQVANWMARELVPKLEKRAAAGQDREVWCNDCHAGKAKILGNPRQRGFAIEWMTTHLGEEFQTTSGKSPKCKQCHHGDLGSPDFKGKLILSELKDLPAAPGVAPLEAPVLPPPDAVPAGSAVPAAPLPDYGAR